MKWLHVGLALGLLVAWSIFQTTGVAALTGAARQKPGPVTVRGLAIQVTPHRFQLKTTTHGTFTVVVSSATRIVEKGVRGSVQVHEGDHVGVNGFTHGSTIDAIRVRIYPVKSKPSSIRGVVKSVSASTVSITVSGRVVTITITNATQIRLGSGPGSLKQIQVGQHIQALVQSVSHGLVAIHIHVYIAQLTGQRVDMQGTVVGWSGGILKVRTGSSVADVHVTSQSRIYVGTTHSTSSSLHSGQSVLVHACCRGASIVATSVHIRTVKVSHPSTLIHGRVSAVSPSTVRLDTSAGPVTIHLLSSTSYWVGLSTSNRADLRVGDVVIVRAVQNGSVINAQQVRVDSISRRPRTVIGTVTERTKTGWIVLSRGQRVALVAGATTKVTVDGKRSTLNSIQVGDHVHATGSQRGSGIVGVTQVTVSRKTVVVRLQTVHGTIAQLHGTDIGIIDDGGRHLTVRLSPGTRPLVHGQPAPDAVFIGARVSVRGRLNGSVLVASTMTLQVRTRSVLGRVQTVSSTSLLIRRSAGETVQIDLPLHAIALDADRHQDPRALHPGAYLRVRGYVEKSGALRAVSIRVLHPLLNVRGTVVAVSQGIAVQTVQGEQYSLSFGSSSHITATRGGMDLRPIDVPTGVRAHVSGLLGSDGRVQVNEMTVTLSSTLVRGTISSLSTGIILLQSAGAHLQIRLLNTATFSQGTRVLTAGDLVAGDEVTVYGYAVAHDTVLGRKILVHRSKVVLDGLVSAVTADGFTMVSSDGSHRVIIEIETSVLVPTGTRVTTGMTVHVTGYRRGDNVILATRIRAAKSVPAPRIIAGNGSFLPSLNAAGIYAASH